MEEVTRSLGLDVGLGLEHFEDLIFFYDSVYCLLSLVNRPGLLSVFL